MKIRCIIVDDEPLAINVIKKHLKGFENFEIVACCNDAMEAFQVLKSNKEIQLMFLDINMPELSGMDFIKSLDSKPLIVITTAYREFAVEGFELDVLDYLVKPIALSRFMKTLDKVMDYCHSTNLESQSKDENDHIFIKVDKKNVKVLFREILYIESLKDYVRVVTEYENLISHYTLRSITKALPSDKFIRIHRSFTVARDKIKSLEGNNVEVLNKKIPIGRNYQKDIKSIILNEGG